MTLKIMEKKTQVKFLKGEFGCEERKEKNEKENIRREISEKKKVKMVVIWMKRNREKEKKNI